MTEEAKVVRVEAGETFVRIDRNTNCSTCRMCGFKRGQTYIDVKAENEPGAEEGDCVVIETAKNFYLPAAAIVYILPLIVASIGFFIGYMLESEILMITLCLIFLVLGYIIIAAIDRRLSKNKNLRPKIIRIVKGEKEDE